jgi:hypothetical protein
MKKVNSAEQHSEASGLEWVKLWESKDAVMATTMQILAGDYATTAAAAVCVVSAPPSQHTGSGDTD